MKLYELFIGLRYLKSKKSQGFISFNTILSIMIVFIGVFILIVVISVMNGFQSQIKDKILDVDSHITISNAFNEQNGISDYKSIVEKLKKIKTISSINPYIQGQALLRHRTHINPVMIRGIGEHLIVPDDVSKFIVKGEKSFSKSRGVFIGEEMAKSYEMKIGQYIELIVPRGRLTAKEGVTPGIGSFKILGYFKTGYYDFDTKLIIMSLNHARGLFEIGNRVWGIGVKIENVLYNMNKAADEIKEIVGFRFATFTAEERNQNLFYALKLEKLIMTIILFLVIVSAGFTIMGTLVMVVMEKRKAIGILKSMGAKPNSIMIIFVLEGFLIGVIGAISGVVLGLAAALNLEAIILWIEKCLNDFLFWMYEIFDLGFHSHITLVPSNVYYIDTIPTEINPEFVIFISIFAVFLSTVAAIFPAWQASRLKPVDTMRYE